MYLAQEYKAFPERKKKEYIDAVKSYSPKVLPVYYITVAEDLYSSDKNFAAFLYFAGKYRAIQDAFACTDESSYEAVDLLATVAPKISNYVAKMDNKEIAKISQKMLDWDEKYPERPNPQWICYHGIDVFSNNGKVTTIPAAEFEQKKKEVRDSVVKFIENN